MNDDFEHTHPASSTPLSILTALDLLVVIAGAAAVPITSFASNSTVLNPLHSYGISNTQLVWSVPMVGVVMVILAWLAQASGKVLAARLLAATPLFWGMAVFLMMAPAIG